MKYTRLVRSSSIMIALGDELWQQALASWMLEEDEARENFVYAMSTESRFDT